ncbi:hypothetical protein ACI798_01665 [Geodermatophilus sp. SYSU D01045]
MRHADRGSSLGAGADPWLFVTPESPAADVRTTVLPDDPEETGEDHPWGWLSALLRQRGGDASPAELRHLPHDVEFSDRLDERLPARA